MLALGRGHDLDAIGLRQPGGVERGAQSGGNLLGDHGLLKGALGNLARGECASHGVW